MKTVFTIIYAEQKLRCFYNFIVSLTSVEMQVVFCGFWL